MVFLARRGTQVKLQSFTQTYRRDFQGFAIFGNSASRNYHALFTQHVRNLTVG